MTKKTPTRKPASARGPKSLLLPPMPLSFEEALGDYLRVKPNAPSVSKARASVVPSKPAKARKRKAAKKR